MHSFWSRLLVVIAGISLLGVFNITPPAGSSARGAAAAQSNGITLFSPANCPQGGCAAGQTLTMLISFPISGYDAALSPNLKVCVFAHNDWRVDTNAVMMDTQGKIPGLTYSPDPDKCSEIAASLPNYSVVAAEQAAVTGSQTGDELRVSVRISWLGGGTHQFKARIMTRNSGGWNVIQDLNSSDISVLQPAEPYYVANDPNGCQFFSPCFVNSGMDGAGGFGTALKDAVDAVPAGSNNWVIKVLGSYTIKTNAVAVNQPATITSDDSAPGTITYSGIASDANCAAPMLVLQDSITLSNLYIQDGTCTSKNRTLVEVNPDPGRDIPINITSNTLSGGLNAIFVHDIKAQVNVTFNDIFGNSGYALYWDGASRQGPLRLTANNLIAGSAFQVDCAGGTSDVQNNRLANHNYWGKYIPDSNTHCSVTPSKRLGARIAARANRPGVSAVQVTVTEKTATRQPTPTLGPTEEATATPIPFYGQLAFARSGDGSQDFPLYIVDHGPSPETGQPFASDSLRGQSACSNYYDFFLPDGVNPPNTTLDLFFYFDGVSVSSECAKMLAVSSPCLNRTPTPETVPLMWYNPTAAPTAWSSVVQSAGSDNGQPVTCNAAQKIMHVAIDANGRPGLSSDLNYTPLLLGAPVLQSFQVFGEYNRIRLEWKTSVEPDVAGFYILSGDSPTTLVPISDMIDRSGTYSSGTTYSYTDTDLVNGETYYYRLQIKRKDGKSFYSEIRSIAPNIPTSTLPGATATRPPTSTPTITLVRTSNPTHAWTATASLGPGTPSPTVFLLPTLTGPAYTPTPLFGLSGTPGVVPSTFPQNKPQGLSSQSPTVTVTLPPDQATGTAIALAKSMTPAPTRRPTRTATPGLGAVASQPPSNLTWTSLLLGLLAGTVVAFAAGSLWWYMRNRA